MIGGENMYMPLCRECHARESKANADNAYSGDPSKISVEIENKQFAGAESSGQDAASNSDKDNAETPKQGKFTPESSLTGTTASGDSPKAKSFSSEDSLERENESITLRKLNSSLR